jgi:TPR repeat protein
LLALILAASSAEAAVQMLRPTNCSDLEKSKGRGDMMYAGTAMCWVRTAEPSKQKQGMDVLRREAERGNEYAISSLVTVYTEGVEGIPKNVPEGIKVLEASVSKGSKTAKARLGIMLMHGEMVEKNSVRGEELLREAADAGDASAQFNLFMSYRRGVDIPRNVELSESYWKLLEANKDPFAAMFLASGRQARAREAQNTTALLERAESGEASAQFTLAKVFLESRKYDEALKWMRASAEQQFALAMVELAIMYDQPLGVDKDSVLAASWLRQAAEKGYPGAQNLLAEKYFHGSGVEKSPAIGLFWLKVAEMLGSEKASATFRAESAQQPADVVLAATAKAKQYLEMHPEFKKQPDGTYIYERLVGSTISSPDKKD